MKSKMNYSIRVLFSLLIILFSCCQKSKDHRIESDIESYFLTGVELKSDDPDFFTGKMIDIHDSLLYVTSLMKDTLINVYRIKDDSLILTCKFLNKGLGPYDVNVFTTLYSKKNETLSFFENSGRLSKGYVINLKFNQLLSDKSLWKVLSFNKMENVKIGSGYAYVSDSLLLVTGGRYNEREIFSLINLNDLQFYPLSYWPDDGFKGNNIVKQGIYTDNARIFRNDELEKYLYVAGYGKYMEIFSIKENRITDCLPVCQIYPQYQVAEDGYYSTEKCGINQGFYVYVTDKLIYARPIEFTLDMLRSGQSHGGYELNFSNTIDVYDWAGHLVKKYKSDTPFYSFVVDETNNILYMQTTDLETGGSIIKKSLLID